MEHKTTIDKYDGELKELARDIADLRYDALSDFFKELENCIRFDSTKDWNVGRSQLSNSLHDTALKLWYVSDNFRYMWEVLCKNKMKGENDGT